MCSSDLSRSVITLSDWHAGLAAWSMGDFETAVMHFNYLSRNPNASARYQSAASVWAARTYVALDNPDQATKMLQMAIENGRNNFYALLAHRRLHGPVAFTWTNIKTEPVADIIDYRSVPRAMKLLDADQQELAELELLYLKDRLTEKQQRALLELSLEHDLPAVELAVTQLLDKNGDAIHKLAKGYFPLPKYTPTVGYTVDPALMFALMRQESRFKARSKSSAGARGLMQIMPATAAFVTGDRKLRYRSHRDQLYRISLNLNIGQAYLKGLLQDEGIENNLIKVLASYNAGPGSVKRWAREIGRADDPLLFLESMRAPETRLYVQKVLANLWIYRDRMGQPSPSLDQLASGEWPLYKVQR